MRTLYWVRNDLRLHDNETLQHFVRTSDEGAMVWFESASFRRAAQHRRHYILSSLLEFQKSLKTVNAELVVSTESLNEALVRLLQEHKFDQICFSKHVGQEELADELFVEAEAVKAGVKVVKFEDNFLIHPKNLNFEIEKMPLVFTDFRKRIEKDLRIEAVMPSNSYRLRNCKVLELTHLKRQSLVELPSIFYGGHVGEQAALERLNDYLWKSQCVLNYKNTRNGMLNFNDSTKFSPFLSVGSLSARHIYHELKKFEKEVEGNESTYWVIFELLWRDYFKFLALKIRNNLYRIGGLRNTKQDLDYNRELFQKWAQGHTPSDFINANMNELNKTGWMSNRGRQNVASYLIHDLHLPWVWGAEYFEAHLIDYDVTSNWGNWLYLSGQGTDPRSRKFNIEKQAQDYDARSEYRKKWLA